MLDWVPAYAGMTVLGMREPELEPQAIERDLHMSYDLIIIGAGPTSDVIPA